MVELLSSTSCFSSDIASVQQIVFHRHSHCYSSTNCLSSDMALICSRTHWSTALESCMGHHLQHWLQHWISSAALVCTNLNVLFEYDTQSDQYPCAWKRNRNKQVFSWYSLVLSFTMVMGIRIFLDVIQGNSRCVSMKHSEYTPFTIQDEYG